MTIASTTSFNRYAGNDVATVFPYTFKLLSEDHLEVIIADSDDVQTTLTLNVHFELSGVGDANGGDVTTLDLTSVCGQATLPTGWTLVAHRVPPATQLTDLVNQGGFFAEVHEHTFDYLTMLVQHLQEQIALCPQVSLTSGLTGDALPAMIADVDAALTASELAQTAAELAQSRAETAAAAAELAADGFEIASEAEAIAGTNNTKSMSPLRVKQSFASEAASQVEAQTGTEEDKWMSPLRTSEAITAKIASQAEAEAGTDDTKIMVPLKTFQAVKALHSKSNPTNLLSNGDFGAWSAGASAAPDGWTLGGVSAAVAKEVTIIKLGTSSAKVTRAGANATISQNVHLEKGIAYWKGRTVTFGCWVYATVASRACVRIYDGVNFTYSTAHSGNSTWQWLTASVTVDASATVITLACQVLNGDTDAYFDGAMCVEGEIPYAFSPQPARWTHSGLQVYSGTIDTNWTDIDCSPVCGARYSLVFIKCVSSDGVFDSGLIVRPNGEAASTKPYGSSYSAGPLAFEPVVNGVGYLLCETDSAGKLEMSLGAASATITVTVQGFI